MLLRQATQGQSRRKICVPLRVGSEIFSDCVVWEHEETCIPDLCLAFRSEDSVGHRWMAVLHARADRIRATLTENDLKFLQGANDIPYRNVKQWSAEEDGMWRSHFLDRQSTSASCFCAP